MAHAAVAADASLIIKPRVCALTKAEDLCREQIDIQWQSDLPMGLCLFIQDRPRPLECWHDQVAGRYRYQVNTDEPLVFQLRQATNHQLVARTRFKVIREQTDYRRRRRKPWNFF